VLTRDAGSAQRGYETAMQRYVVSQVESRASQTHVSVLNPATAHANRTGQGRLNVALSVVVGTMLGIGIVILLEMSDRRVRSRMDLDVTRLCRCSACLMHGSHLRGCCLLGREAWDACCRMRSEEQLWMP